MNENHFSVYFNNEFCTIIELFSSSFKIQSIDILQAGNEFYSMIMTLFIYLNYGGN